MPDDLDKLQGTWHVTSLVVDGQRMTIDTFEGSTIVINGRRVLSKSGDGRSYTTWRLSQDVDILTRRRN